ncbi:MAG: hypothetical protein LBE20_04990 [Deltaproteobacteria bacterium]|nr:hypothetical protein [Deltaproteobacteria bacterium]
MCVISTPNTPAIFKDSLVRSIESKGYVVKVINYGESSVCQLDIAYQTKWHSSSKSLLTYVKIQAYKDNKIIASNAYEQRISSNSEINSVQDITRYLVNKMFTDLVTWREKHPTIKRPGYIE